MGRFVVLKVLLAILLGKRKYFSSITQIAQLSYTVRLVSVESLQHELTKAKDEMGSF